jgi:alpha-L-rhamnosidase
VEAGLLRPDDWRATAITLPHDPGGSRTSPAPFLRREFELDDAPRRARLYVTSLGVHAVRINGQRVGHDLLSPGWTSYHHRLLTETYDVTPLLVAGGNAVGAMLADGWYRGRLGWPEGKDRCRYGKELGLLLQLELDLGGRTTVMVSDGSWRATTAEILSADLYDGTVTDLREQRPGWDRAGYDDSSWQQAVEVELAKQRLEPRMAAPVRAIETRPMTTLATERGLTLDSGQNLAGFAVAQAAPSTRARTSFGIAGHCITLKAT